MLWTKKMLITVTLVTKMHLKKDFGGDKNKKTRSEEDRTMN